MLELDGNVSKPFAGAVIARAALEIRAGSLVSTISAPAIDAGLATA